MAANKRNYKTEKTKQKIRDTINTKLCIDKLQAHLNDEIEMKGTQIKAAEVLLARTLPTLTMADVVNHDAPDNYEDMLQGLAEMAGDNAPEVFKLLGLTIIDNETNQELN